MSFSERCRAINNWGEAIRKAALTHQPWPELDLELFYIPPNSSSAQESGESLAPPIPAIQSFHLIVTSIMFACAVDLALTGHPIGAAIETALAVFAFGRFLKY